MSKRKEVSNLTEKEPAAKRAKTEAREKTSAELKKETEAETIVVNVRKSMKQKHDIYIGRNVVYTGHKQSKWANPYTVKKYGMKTCLEKYEVHVRRSPALMASLEELRGKRLGCWCAPGPCHGDVLVRLLAERLENKSN